MVDGESRIYIDCAECGLISLSPEFRISSDQEFARYQLHNNSPDDPNYIQFLSRVVTPLQEHLQPGMLGLDYGCGPGPAIPIMLAKVDCKVQLYDPFFYPREFSSLDRFDFVISTETIEHFFDPAAEFLQITSLIRAGGFLALMTEILDDSQDFASWWYIQDPTHVSFYRDKTFGWLAMSFGWTLIEARRNVRIFRL